MILVSASQCVQFQQQYFWFNNCFGCCLSYCSVTQSCLTLCSPMGCSTPGFPVLQHLPEFAQTHFHWVGDAIQPSHPLLPPSPGPPGKSHNVQHGIVSQMRPLGTDSVISYRPQVVELVQGKPRVQVQQPGPNSILFTLALFHCWLNLRILKIENNCSVPAQCFLWSGHSLSP